MNKTLRHILLFFSALCAVQALRAGNIHVHQNSYLYTDTLVWNDAEYQYRYVAVGKNDGTSDLLLLQRIEHTHLYYVSPTSDYLNYDYVCLFAANSSWGTSGGSYANLHDYGANITLSQNDYGFNANDYYLLRPEYVGTKEDLSPLDIRYIGNIYSILNQSQRVRVLVSADGGSSYNEPSDWPATIQAEGVRFSAYNAVSDVTQKQLSNADPVFDAAYTSQFTLTESATHSDYTFAGWFNAAGDTLSTDATYTYTVPLGQQDIFARFNQKPRLSLTVVGKGTTSFNPSSRITVQPTVTGIAGNVAYKVVYAVSGPANSHSTVMDKEDTHDVVVSGDAVGTYTITAELRAGADGSGKLLATAQETFEIHQYVTLQISGTPSVGQNVTLTANSSLTGTYIFTVVDPDGGFATQLQSGKSKTCNYSIPMEGDYTFYVTVPTPEGKNATAECHVTVKKELSIYYNFLTSSEGGRANHAVEFTYDEVSGTYFYYQNKYYKDPSTNKERFTSSYTSGTVNATIKNGSTNTNLHINTDRVSSPDNKVCVFVYNPRTEELYLEEPGTTRYRIKSVCGNKTYYSNSVSRTDLNTDSVLLSFYATFDGELKWQKSEVNEFGWVDTLSIVLTDNQKNKKDGVFITKALHCTSNSLGALTPYTGDFYLFSDVCADTTNVMARFNNISADEFYNHYWVKWLGTSVNTEATVGNNINHCLADRKQKYTPNPVNVRFAYNPETNYFSRTFLAGSSGSTANTFLRVYGTNVIASDNHSYHYADLSTALPFQDGSDWVYTADLTASPTAEIVLAAQFAGKTTYLLSQKGLETDRKEILGSRSSNATNLPFRIIYDFKTNRVIAAWCPTETTTITNEMTVDADMLVVRNSYNDSLLRMVQFSSGGKATVLRRIITELEIDRNTLYNTDKSKSHQDASDLFQITLPYEADMTSVFGLANYGQDWVLQDYKGEVRAKTGWSKQPVNGNGFWGNLVWKNGTKLRKGRGYVVATNYNYDSFEPITFHKGESGEFTIAKKTLFFPSPVSETGYVLDGKQPDVMVYPELRSTVSGRDPFDSNWRCIGAPSFYPVTIKMEGLQYFYRWNEVKDSYTLVRVDETPMQPTRNYLIQQAGSASWETASTAIARYGSTHAPALRAPAAPSDERRLASRAIARYGSTYQLSIIRDSVPADPTYIQLSPDGTDDYRLGGDVQKLFSNSAPQLFTLVGGYELAACHVSDTTSQVRLGINLSETGDYILSLSSISAGAQSPVLFDSLTNTYVNLSEQDYPFSCEGGVDTGRFRLLFGQVPAQTTSLPKAMVGEATFNICLTDGQILISSNEPITGTLRLFDVSGRLVALYKGTGATTMQLSPPLTGLYLVQYKHLTYKMIHSQVH